MRVYVHSTLTCDHIYTNWNPPPDPKSLIRTIQSQVTIKGGANLANVDNPRNTPKAVTTEVTEKEYDQLQRNSVFQKHLKRGFIVVTMAKVDAEVVAKADMQNKDHSAPLTPDDKMFKKQGEEAVKPMVDNESTLARVKGAVGL